MSIRLHPKLGVNPRLIQATCPICGLDWETNEIILLGASNYRERCPECKAWVFGGVRRGQKCPSCGRKRDPYKGWERIELEEHEQLRDRRTCPNCEALLEQGSILIEVEDGEPCSNPLRTGRLFCIRPEALERMDPLLCGKKVAYIFESLAEKIGLHDVEPTYSSVEEMRESTTPI